MKTHKDILVIFRCHMDRVIQVGGLMVISIRGRVDYPASDISFREGRGARWVPETLGKRGFFEMNRRKQYKANPSRILRGHGRGFIIGAHP
jgi:hypothetical protein